MNREMIDKEVVRIIDEHTTVGKADLHKGLEHCGLDSLSYISILQELEMRFNISVDEQLLFTAPTPMDIADHIEDIINDSNA